MPKRFIGPLSILLAFSIGSDCSASDRAPELFIQPATNPAPYPSSYSTGVTKMAPLQGGIKDQSVLNPSLRLTPQYQGRINSGGNYGQIMTPRTDEFAPVQYKGNVRTGPAAASTAEVQSPLQFSGNANHGGNPINSNVMFGVISPISSFNRTPPGGVVNYIPGSDFTAVTSGSSSINSSLPMPSQYKTVGRGLTVLSPELAVSATPAVGPRGPAVPLTGGFFQSSMMQTIGPGLSVSSAMRSSLPENEQSHWITRNHISAAPGYEVTITPPGLSQETLGGRWSANMPSSLSAVPTSLSAVPGTLQAQRIFTRIEPVSEVARTGVLTEMQANRTCGSWPEWYRVVAKAIYTHWQNADVCPGTAKIEVTVKPDHDISGRVVDFIPAADVERNVPRETEFRETSLRIVNHVGYFEIPDFPAGGSNQVVFDIDLKRTVNGPTGVSITGITGK